MEPLNCVVKLTQDSCEVWNGEQFQTGDQFAIAKATGLKPAQIHEKAPGWMVFRDAQPVRR